MAFNGLRLEYALEGTYNFIAWKDHMEAILDENGLQEYIKRNATKTQASDAHNFAQWKKDVVKARRIILEGVRDHIITNLHGKQTPYTMWQALIDLFQNGSDHRKLVLKDKLRNIKLQKNDTIPQYLIRFTQVRDELA